MKLYLHAQIKYWTDFCATKSETTVKLLHRRIALRMFSMKNEY